MGEFDDLGRNQFEEGDYYINEMGYRVFTSQYLLKRGIVAKMVVNIAHGWDNKTQKFSKKYENVLLFSFFRRTFLV